MCAPTGGPDCAMKSSFSEKHLLRSDDTARNRELPTQKHDLTCSTKPWAWKQYLSGLLEMGRQQTASSLKLRLRASVALRRKARLLPLTPMHPWEMAPACLSNITLFFLLFLVLSFWPCWPSAQSLRCLQPIYPQGL